MREVAGERRPTPSRSTSGRGAGRSGTSYRCAFPNDPSLRARPRNRPPYQRWGQRCRACRPPRRADRPTDTHPPGTPPPHSPPTSQGPGLSQSNAWQCYRLGSIFECSLAASPLAGHEFARGKRILTSRQSSRSWQRERRPHPIALGEARVRHEQPMAGRHFVTCRCLPETDGSRSASRENVQCAMQIHRRSIGQGTHLLQ